MDWLNKIRIRWSKVCYALKTLGQRFGFSFLGISSVRYETVMGNRPASATVRFYIIINLVREMLANATGIRSIA